MTEKTKVLKLTATSPKIEERKKAILARLKELVDAGDCWKRLDIADELIALGVGSREELRGIAHDISFSYREREAEKIIRRLER